jgi:hypothetical protein
LQPIRKPDSCEFTGEVFKDKVYKKSFCVDESSRNFEDSGSFCRGNGMQLLDLFTMETHEKLTELARKEFSKLPTVFTYINDGGLSTKCSKMDMKDGTIKFRTNDCKTELRSVCEFIDVESERFH